MAAFGLVISVKHLKYRKDVRTAAMKICSLISTFVGPFLAFTVSRNNRFSIGRNNTGNISSLLLTCQYPALIHLKALACQF